jgi:hypothetical protein
MPFAIPSSVQASAGAARRELRSLSEIRVGALE